MGYLASLSAFVVVDADTGRLVSDKVYTSRKWAERYITAGSYAKNRAVVEISPEIILAILREAK
ncbi:hypothetical protein C4A76_10605 [Brevibacillus laterosporus]|nr:hypothetical protein C4A76_10605 [Brevibacillus laterosporus]